MPVQRIRNGKIRRDFKRLLTLLASVPELGDTREEEDVLFSEVEEIAKRNGLYFDDDGNVREVRE